VRACPIVCDLETSKKRLTRPELECCDTDKEITLAVNQYCVISNCIGRWDLNNMEITEKVRSPACIPRSAIDSYRRFWKSVLLLCSG